MKEGWKYQPLGEICDLLNGFAFKSNLYVNEGIRVIRIANVQKGYIEDSAPAFYPFSYEDELSRYMLQEGDLLMSLTGNVGRVGILNKEMLPAALNQRVACIRLKKKDVLLKYLFHYFNSDYFEKMCIASSHGAAQLNMSTVWLAKHLVPVPPLTEQERIVALLDDQFAKIDALKANIEQQLQAAKDLFQSALKEVFEANRNWKYSYFSEVYPIVMGKTPARADISLWDKKKETHNLWVSIADISVNEGKYILDTEEYVSKKAASKMRIVSKGSLLMSFKLTIGKMAFAGDDLFTNEAIIAIPDNGKYNLRFLYYYLSNYNWSTLTDGAEKVKGKTLNKTSIGKILLPILSLPEQERIAARLDAISEKVKALQANYDQTITLCNDLKQSLLKSIFA